MDMGFAPTMSCVVAAAACARALQLAAASLRLPFEPDELYRVPTDDGATIALGRYLPRERRRFSEPVILCHGLGANRFGLDYDDRYSLARYLARRGYETWVLELRGRSLSGAHKGGFDAQAEHDVRAAIRAVRAAGHSSVTWVGHSKGGLLLYAHLARNPSAPIKAAVTIGSPVSFHAQPGLKDFIKALGPLLKLKVIPTKRAIAACALLGVLPDPFSRYLRHEPNMDPVVARRSAFNMSSDISGSVARQFAQWISSGKFNSMDGTFDYAAGMAGVRIPMLLVAGTADLLAPPDAAFQAGKLLGGPVQYTLAGLSAGLSADYGHGDLVLGRRAPEEVFPGIEEFLSRNSAAALV
jgi:alpha-beta hydrolase superfamily lysophospholipase